MQSPRLSDHAKSPAHAANLVRARQEDSTPQKQLLVPTLIFLGVVSAAVGSLGAPLLPTIVVVDHVSVASSQWVLTISLLVGAVAAPVMGRLGDGRRRRPVILGAVLAGLIGCILSALPLGFGWLLIGRGLQGIGLGLVPLAIAVARDSLPPERSGPTIALLGVTTAIGIGIGYPIAGLITEYLSLDAAFWAGAVVNAVALILGAIALPASPDRPPRRIDALGATLLGLGVAGLLLVLAEGQVWGWTSTRTLAAGVVAIALLIVWIRYELRVPNPLIDLRLLRHRSVFAANSTVLLIGIGIYPLLSLVVRYVQAPTSTGYGFGASVVIAGLMLLPFSLASFLANKVAGRVGRRWSPELVVAGSTIVLLIAMVIFLLARDAYWQLVVTMALAGFGVGCVFASNPSQIVRGV
ncbi:MAG TPA: MFS transporter, partial [Thermomicrobiales bacterium]|nr:MFS transporter [Thermomicrobiales bacterium]